MQNRARTKSMFGITLVAAVTTPVAIVSVVAMSALARYFPWLALFAASLLFGLVGMLASGSAAVASGVLSVQHPARRRWRVIEAGNYLTFVASGLPIAVGLLPVAAVVAFLACVAVWMATHPRWGIPVGC